MNRLTRIAGILAVAWWRGVCRLAGLFGKIWLPFLLIPFAIGLVDLHADYAPYRIVFIVAYFVIVAPILLEITNAQPQPEADSPEKPPVPSENVPAKPPA
jgi:hypothetical protein